MLPECKSMKESVINFPTAWQTVIFRNYGYVSLDKIAAVLDCAEEIIILEADRMGLQQVTYNPIWEEKGYITLIRNNWNVLSYTQLLTLLGISEERLAYILQYDDFLSVKLGEYKPECKTIKYVPLTDEEKCETDELAKIVIHSRRVGKERPFAFFEKKNLGAKIFSSNSKRIVHGYLSPCGDVFSISSDTYLPDALLKMYSENGVNGIWLHGLLSTLSPYPFNEAYSEGFGLRREEMQRLVNRCQKYGIKLYLYLNEPRGLPIIQFGKYSSLIGRTENGYASLCFEKKEVQQYLYEAVKSLFQSVHGLGGIITITMSENLTHCNYRPETNCPICKKIPPQESAAKVNNIIAKALRDSGSDAELIANLWGWSPFMGWTEQQTLEGVDLLDKDVAVMCVSEYDLNIQKGGIKSRIIDYSIGNPGPSEITKKTLKRAEDKGHQICAKIQTNNSWECSCVPYIPVFDLVYQHLKNLTDINVKDYMLTWTLGGYPSVMLQMVAEYCETPMLFNIQTWYRKTFGDDAGLIQKAVEQFCKGFAEYPFSIDSLYFSPKTLGPANLWELEPQQKKSTMVCFSFDDYESWINPYPVDIYLSQYEKVINSWSEGLSILENVKTSALVEEIKRYAKAALAHFKSDYLQTRFAVLKRNNIQKDMVSILNAERNNTQDLLSLLYEDARIGYEASNHYYYTERNLIEKIIQMERMIKVLESKKI